VIFLDATVLLYAKSDHQRFRVPCEQLLEAVADGRVAATTTPEVIQECVHVRSRRRSRSDAGEFGRIYAALLSPLAVIEEADLRDGLMLFERHQLGSCDAVLAAAALSVDAAALVSADKAFADVNGLRHVVPDAAGVAELLGPD